MSVKAIVIVLGAALALASYSTSPVADVPANSAVATHASAATGVLGKARHAVGSVGSWIVGGIVTRMADGSDHEVQNLRPALKKKQGSDGMRAREAAQNVLAMDSIARDHLRNARPVSAVNTAMRARDYLDVAKRNLGNP